MTTPTASEEERIAAAAKLHAGCVSDGLTVCQCQPEICEVPWLIAELRTARAENAKLRAKSDADELLIAAKMLDTMNAAKEIVSLRASLERMEAVVEAAREAASHTYPDMDDHNGACLIRNLHDAIAALDAEGNGT